MIEPCYKCSGPIEVYAQYGGKGTGNLTHYVAKCGRCGVREEELGTDGTRRSAVAQWNRIARQKRSDGDKQ